MTPSTPNIVDSYTLSPTQAGMLYHAVRDTHTGVDIEQVVMTLPEKLDEPAFVFAWNEVIKRHTILRTQFRWDDIAEPRQEVVAKAEIPVLSVDWRSFDPTAVADRLSTQLASDRQQDFDLALAPAMRLFLARVGPTAYRVVWTFHHALLDGRSFPVVLREVFAIYDAARGGEAVPLQDPQPYRKYIERLQALDLSGAEQYWGGLLKGFGAATPFGVDISDARTNHRPSIGSLYGARQTRLTNQITSMLRDRASAVGVTVNTLLQAAWAVLLHRYSGESDIVFGTTRAGRHTGLEIDSSALVGLFINTVPMRVDVDAGLDIATWLRTLRERQLQMRPFEHAPLVKVQSWSSVARGKPLFESIVVYDHETLDTRMRRLGGDWDERHFDYIGQTNYPLAVVAYGDDEMLLRLEYSRRRFADTTVERMLSHLVTVLEGLAFGEAKQVKDLRLLTAEQRAELAVGSVAVRTYPRGRTLHEQFERQVDRTPDAIALTAYGEDGARLELSYAQLNRRANHVAHQLRELGVVPNQLVGLRTERNAEIVVGILAILKAGGAYLPLDPVYPKDRVAFMLEDSRVKIVLTQTSLKGDLAGIAATVVCLDEPPAPGADSAKNLFAANAADDLAYVIYTSGSTGKPKGVRITHYNVSRLFAATDHWFGFNERDVWTLFHSYAFDFSVWELWGALLYGGRVVTVSLDVSRSIDAFQELLVREQVTVLNQTPTAFRRLIDVASDSTPTAFALRYVIFGGEALELQSLRPWFDRFGDAKPRLVNMYGITETTVHVTYRPIALADLDAGAGSVIGVPIPDLKVYVLDPQGEPVPIGVPGEMYVAGAGVGLGYLNRSELTEQRFLQDPFDGNPGTRMYRSGDLARRLENGDIEYLGRIDQQVKIRGFRIELGEIEALIAHHPSVRQVAVIAREDVPGDKRLVAYVVSDDEQDRVIEQLRESIRAALPDYMMPAHFVFVPILPLTQNGKLDRRALPAPAESARETNRPFIAPRNAVEQAIADVWKAVLRVDRVSVDDHFFDLGGDSILSIQVISRCRQQGLRFTPKDLFDRPTVTELARVVGAGPIAARVVSEPASGDVALTPIQHWFFEQQFADQHYWNQAFLFQVPSNLDLQALDVSLRKLVSHHDALRMRYSRAACGRWRQEYSADNIEISASHIDLMDVDADDRATVIEAHCAAAQETFNLETGPMLRAVHFSLGPTARGRLLVAIHHLVVDGVSWRVLREDLETLYLAAAGGSSPALAEKTSSVQAWASALCEHAQSAAVRSSFEHWRAVAAKGLYSLPLDAPGRSRPPTASLLVTRLSREETQSLLQQLPAIFQTQINDALLTALARALQKVTGATSLRVDLEGHGREHIADDVDISRTVGWFTSLFPIALEIEPSADGADALLAIRDQLHRIPDRGLSFGLLRYLSNDAAVRDTLSGTVASPVLFNYLGQFDAVVADSALFSFAEESTGPWRSPHAKRTHDLEVVALVRDGQLEIAWHHDANAPFEASVEQVANSMMATLREFIAIAQSTRRRAPNAANFPLARLDEERLAQLTSLYPSMQDIYPLTPMQRLFLAMETSQANLGFEQWHFRLDGVLDTRLLRQAIGLVIERHDMLRTAFVADGGSDPHQIVSGEVPLPWSEEDWRALAPKEQSEQLAALLSSDARLGFDLARPPLMRMALRRVADESFHLVWSTHHLYIDGWSWPIVFRDMSRSYAALEAGKTVAPDEPTTFKAYVKWLTDSAPQSEHFWKEQLAGFTAPTPLRLSRTELHPDAKQPEAQPHAEVFVCLPIETTNSLQALARSARVTMSAVFNCAWALLLSHYNKSHDIVFGAAFSGRPSEIEGIESMVGPCVNNLPVRLNVEPSAKLSAWLAEIQRRQFNIAQHQYAPLEQIQEWAGIPWRHRLFDSLVVFQNYQVDADARRIGAHVVSTLLSAPEATNYRLTLTVSSEKQLQVRLLYKPEALARADVEQFAADLSTALSSMAAGSAVTASDVLAALPADSRGKASETALAVPGMRRSAYVAPSSNVERDVASVWQDLFGVESVSLDDNFFDLGGHSVLLVQAHARLKSKFGIEIPIVALLQYPTVRSLARHLSGGGEADREQAASVAMDRAQKQRLAQSRQRNLAGKRTSP